MKRYSKITPEGTRDLLFEECTARNLAKKELAQLFQSRGYHQVVTPTMEFYDVFNRESSGRPIESLYSLIDSQGRMLVLRADTTLPIARIAATRLRDVAYPLRLCYHQNVFRRSPRYAGLEDEAFQSGIELIGVSGLRADLEVLSTAIAAMAVGETPHFRIEIGHADFFAALAEELQLSHETQQEICDLIETKNFGALNDLLDALNDPKGTAAMRRLPRLFGGPEILEQAESLSEHPRFQQAIAYLREIYQLLKQAGMDDQLSFDLGLVHRSHYYTGIVFRGYIDGFGQTVLSGGRYDALMAEFGEDLPAIGFGIEVGALAQVLLHRGRETLTPKAADILVFAEPGHEVPALLHCRERIAQGFICENSLASSFQEAVLYAQKKGIARLELVDAQGVTEHSNLIHGLW